jgi:hypothetical protein
MRLRFLSFFWISLALTACSTFKVKHPIESQNRVYPDGSYRHEVSIQTPDGRKQTFDGVVSLAPDKILVVGLSPFGTTVFRLDDDLKTGTQKVDIFVDQLKKHEAKLRLFYGVLKTMLLLPATSSDGKALHREVGADGLLASLETTGLEESAKIEFSNYDDHRIPLRARVTAKKFNVEIRVTGYEL